MTTLEKQSTYLKTFNVFLRGLNFFCLIFFSFLSFIWLALKLKVADLLGTQLNLLSYADIIRSQSTLDLAITLLLLLTCKKSLTSTTRGASIFLFLLLGFYFLKLTGLYAYTYDATPWKMIEYGSYLLQVPFSSPELSFIAYLVIPGFLLLYLTVKIIQSGRNNTIKSQKIVRNTLVTIYLLIACSLIPPLQKGFERSLAYHPYIYSISGAFRLQDAQTTSKTSINEVGLSLGHQKVYANLDGVNIALVILESFSETTIQKDVTPTLFSLRENSLNFSHAYSTIPHTSKALVNIHCGEPYFNPYLFESTLGAREKCLAQEVDKPSVFFQGITKSFENREALVNHLGFDDFYPLESMNTQGYEAVNYFSYEDDIVLPVSKKWIEQFKASTDAQKGFIASYMTGTSHHNYQTPSNFKKTHFTDQQRKNDYLNAASYVDQFVGKLMNQYKEEGLLNNTLFIFVGDHGEGFNENQALMHNNNLYQSGLHIPMFFYSPALLSAATIDEPVSQNRIKPLILNFSTHENLEKVRTQADRPELISSCWYMDYCYAITQEINNDIYKLIDDRRNKRYLLYNLSQDPNESNNIYPENHALAGKLSIALNKAVSDNLRSYQNYYRAKDAHYLDKKIDTFTAFKSVTHF